MLAAITPALGKANQAIGLFGQIINAFRYLKARRCPKAPRKSIGLGVAISTEDDRERQQIRNDFIQTMSDLLTETDLRTPLAVVVLDPPHCNNIKNYDDAKKLLDKTGCMFLLWGTARNRKVKGEDNFVLDLKSVVRHDAIPVELSQAFAEEIKALLPIRRNISRKDDLTEFELNAASVELSARYILAVAAHLSNQVDLSIEIFEDLQARLRRVKMSSFPLQVRESVRLLEAKIPLQLADLYFYLAGEQLHEWRKTHTPQALERMKEYSDRAERHRPDSYRRALLLALYYFVKHRNVAKARKELAPYKKIVFNDATWAIDEGFLLAYSGNLSTAIRFYRMGINKLGADSRLLVETEEFILWLLTEEPDKVQLHFCLGLINYWGKKDSERARADFKRFLAETEGGEFPEQRELAERYLLEIGD